MPKQRPERRIDSKQTTGSGGGSSVVLSGSSGSLAVHALDSSFHTGTLNTSQAPWAVTTTTYNAHIADGDAHHNQQHNIIGSDHTTTGAAGQLIGLTGTDTLGKVTIADDPGIDVSFASGEYTIGASLGDGVTFVGNDIVVDEDFNFVWTGEHTWATYLGSPSYASGFAGNGWRISSTDASMGLDDLTVRGTMSVYELLVQQIRATNGNVFVTSAAKVASVSGSGPSYTLTIDGDAGTDIQPFNVGDLIRAQRWTGSGTYTCDMTVTAINVGSDSRAFTASLRSGTDAPAAGMEFVRLGSVPDADRQGSVYISADDDEAPFIDIIDGVNSWANWGASSVLKARLGKLTGITDSVIGALSGYGLYSENAYMKGTIVANGGDVVAGPNGLAIQAASASSTSWTDWGKKLTFATDTVDAGANKTVAQIYASQYNATTDWNVLWIEARADTASEADEAHIEITASGEANGSSIQLHGGGSEYIAVVSDAVQFTGTPQPSADDTYDLGTSSKKWRRLYATELIVDEITAPTTSHNHDDRYYLQSEVDTLLADYYTETETDGLFTAHTSDADAHHDQQHGITGSDHTITAAAYSVVGTTATNTLGTLTFDNGAGLDKSQSAGVIKYDISNNIAGNGLTINGKVLHVGAGDGLDLAADSIAVDVTDFIDTAKGLTESSNNIQINLATTSGLEFYSGALQLKDAVAGAGLDISSKVMAVGAGDGIAVATNSVAVSLATTSGLEFDTGALQIGDSIAGAGLAISSKVLAVGAGDGIDVAADSIAVDVTDIIDTAKGLTESSNNIQINLAATSGLGFASGALELLDTVAGYGLDISAKVLAVAPGEFIDTDYGLVITSDKIRIDLATDAGLNFGGGNLKLGTPSTLSVATDNLVTSATHEHAITTASDGSVNTIAAYDGSGHLGAVQFTAPTISTDAVESGGWLTLEGASGIYLGDGDTYAKVTSTGITSLDPAYSSGVNRSGLDITWQGDIDARDITAVNLSTFVFARHQVGAIGTTLAVTTAGKLYADAEIGAVGDTATLQVADPEAGQEQLFTAGQILRISAMAYANPATSSGDRLSFPNPFAPVFGVSGQDSFATVWLEVDSVTLEDGYQEYTVTILAGAENIKYLKGTGVVRWHDGMIVLSSDEPGGDVPYISIFDAGDEPWQDGGSEYIRMGVIGGLGIAQDGDIGIAITTDTSDNNAPRFLVAANRNAFELHKITLTSHDGTRETARLDPDGTFVLSSATTSFGFIPSTGDINLVGDTQMTLDGYIGMADNSAIYLHAAGRDAQSIIDYGYTLGWSTRLNSDGLTLVAEESMLTMRTAKSLDAAISNNTRDMFWLRGDSEDPADAVDAYTTQYNTVEFVAIADDSAYENSDWPETYHGQHDGRINFVLRDRYSSDELTAMSIYGNARDGATITIDGDARVDGVFAANSGVFDTVSVAGQLQVNRDESSPSPMILAGLPTAPDGLPIGAIYHSAGTLKVVY